MKTMFRLLCGCMMIILAACTGDELTQVADTQNTDDTRVVTVKAYTPSENPDSRLAFTENNDQSLSLSWSEGDVFTVVVGESEYTFNYNVVNGTFTSTIPEGTEIPDGTKAYYPCIFDENSCPNPQNGELNADYTYMEGIYDASANSFQFSHSTAILKAAFTGLPDYEVGYLSIKAGAYECNITDLSKTKLEEGIYIYLPALEQNEKMVFNAYMYDTSNEVSKIYTATQTVKPASGIEPGKIYHASIALIEPCELPWGNTFNTAIKGIDNFSNVTSIVFEANSEETGGTQLESSLAYAKVDGSTLKVYTEQPEFMFYSCEQMFNGLTNITSIDFGNDINTSCVTNMSYMFGECTNLQSITFGDNFDTSWVMYMSRMFEGCYALTTLDVSSFDTSCVTDMSGMFVGCSTLTTLDVSSFDTSCVTDMSRMFLGCSGLTTLDVSGFNTSNVYSMSDMFNGCASLQTIAFGNGFITSNVSGMGSMFYGCFALTSLDLSGFDTSSVTGMSWMFVNCRALTSLDLSTFIFGDETSLDNMFEYVGYDNPDKPITIWVNAQAPIGRLGDSNVTKIDSNLATIEVKTE